MSEPVAAPAVPVDIKSVETLAPEVPASESAVEAPAAEVAIDKVETKEEAAPAVEAPAADVPAEALKTEDAPVTEEPQPAPQAEKKEDRPKSPGILAKLLAPFKGGDKKEKKPKKAEKSPVDDAPKEAAAAAEIPAAEAVAEGPAPHEEEVPTAEPPKEPETTEVPVAEAAVEPAADSEAPKDEKVAEKKDVKREKIGRRLSARVTNLFGKHKAADVPAKVEEGSAEPSKAEETEGPPKIEKQPLVAPLDVVSAAPAVAEDPKVEAPPVAPVVAAAA